MGPITCVIVASMFSSTGAKALREIADWMKKKNPVPENKK